MLRTTRLGDTLEWPEDDKTGDGLPPLPEPAHTQVETYSGIAMNKVVETPLYTDDQMRAYAAAAVARERAKIMAELRQALQEDSNAAAIRKGA